MNTLKIILQNKIVNYLKLNILIVIDNLKNKLALENNFKVIRICQRIVWDDKEFWDTQLKEAINNINEIDLIKIGSVYN